jgi:flagellar protein FlaG
MQIELVSATGNDPASLVSTGSTSNNPMPLRDSDSGQKEKAAELAQIEAMAAEFQENLNVLHNVNLRFSVHHASGQVMVAVTDEDTGKIIREIPSREMLDLSAKIDKMMGLIFDQKL